MKPAPIRLDHPLERLSMIQKKSNLASTLAALLLGLVVVLVLIWLISAIFFR